jgi:hypothetical protein
MTKITNNQFNHVVCAIVLSTTTAVLAHFVLTKLKSDIIFGAYFLSFLIGTMFGHGYMIKV